MFLVYLQFHPSETRASDIDNGHSVDYNGPFLCLEAGPWSRWLPLIPQLSHKLPSGLYTNCILHRVSEHYIVRMFPTILLAFEQKKT